MKNYSSPELLSIGSANRLVLGLTSEETTCTQREDLIPVPVSDVSELW